MAECLSVGDALPRFQYLLLDTCVLINEFNSIPGYAYPVDFCSASDIILACYATSGHPTI